MNYYVIPVLVKAESLDATKAAHEIILNAFRDTEFGAHVLLSVKVNPDDVRVEVKQVTTDKTKTNL